MGFGALAASLGFSLKLGRGGEANGAWAIGALGLGDGFLLVLDNFLPVGTSEEHKVELIFVIMTVVGELARKADFLVDANALAGLVV